MGAEPLPRPRPPWAALLLPLLFLTCGAALGGSLTYWVFVEPPRFGPPAPGEMPEKVTAHLRGELDLSEEQAQQVKAIFMKSDTAMHEIRSKVAPEMSAEFDKVEAEIAALLKPEQQEPWHKKINEMRNRLRLPNTPR